MKTGIKQLTVLAAIICLAASAPLLGEGGKNAHNNPIGSPSDDNFEAPYANRGDGRMMVFCAEDEKLLVTPVDGGVIEVTCMLADD